jgi:hypothetical protein
MRALTLIVCSRAKRPGVHPAGSLYVSARFRRQQREAQLYGEWRIVSAKHRLLRPTDSVRSYDQALEWLSAQGKSHWAGLVVSDLYQLMVERSFNLVQIERKHRYTSTLLPVLLRLGFVRIGRRAEFSIWRRR